LVTGYHPDELLGVYAIWRSIPDASAPFDVEPTGYLGVEVVTVDSNDNKQPSMPIDGSA
jgi:hypothetical protein